MKSTIRHGSSTLLFNKRLFWIAGTRRSQHLFVQILGDAGSSLTDKHKDYEAHQQFFTDLYQWATPPLYLPGPYSLVAAASNAYRAGIYHLLHHA